MPSTGRATKHGWPRSPRPGAMRPIARSRDRSGRVRRRPSAGNFLRGGTWQGGRIGSRVYVNVKGKEAAMDSDPTDPPKQWQGRVSEFIERTNAPNVPTNKNP